MWPAAAVRGGWSRTIFRRGRAVYQQFRRWLHAGVFEVLVADVPSIVREWAGRKGQPTAVCIDSRTLQSTPESGARAGYDEAKRRKGSKVHIAVDTLGHLLALTVTPADWGDREQVAALAEQVQQVTGNTVELAYMDQGYTGENAAHAVEEHGIQLEKAPHGQARLRPAATPLGGGAVLRMDHPLSKARTRLRTPPKHTQRTLLCRLRHPHDQQAHPTRNFITPPRSFFLMLWRCSSDVEAIFLKRKWHVLARPALHLQESALGVESQEVVPIQACA